MPASSKCDRCSACRDGSCRLSMTYDPKSEMCYRETSPGEWETISWTSLDLEIQKSTILKEEGREEDH